MSPNDYTDYILTSNNKHEKSVMARIFLSTFLHYKHDVTLSEINSLSSDALIKTLSFIGTNRFVLDCYYTHGNAACKQISKLECLI